MAGHSKWAGIKHKKAVVDARRGKLFTKLLRAIEVAAREGGGNPDSNPTLADAIARAKSSDVPNNTIERAIQRGTGEVEGVSYETITYEGYAPGGVAVLVEAMTDNRNRAAADVRRIFSRNGGNLGDPGSVAWMFSRKGVLIVPKGEVDEDELLALALEAGADEMKDEGDSWELVCPPNDLEALKQAVQAKGIEVTSSQVTQEPSASVPVEGDAARQVLKLIDDLEECDDVQEVFANFDIPDEVLSEVAG